MAITSSKVFKVFPSAGPPSGCGLDGSLTTWWVVAWGAKGQLVARPPAQRHRVWSLGLASQRDQGQVRTSSAQRGWAQLVLAGRRAVPGWRCRWGGAEAGRGWAPPSWRRAPVLTSFLGKSLFNKFVLHGSLKPWGWQGSLLERKSAAWKGFWRASSTSTTRAPSRLLSSLGLPHNIISRSILSLTSHLLRHSSTAAVMSREIQPGVNSLTIKVSKITWRAVDNL